MKNNGIVVLFAKCTDGILPEHPDILKYGFLEYNTIRDLVNAGQLKNICVASCMAIVSKVIHDKGINCILLSDGVSESITRKLGLSWTKSL